MPGRCFPLDFLGITLRQQAGVKTPPPRGAPKPFDTPPDTSQQEVVSVATGRPVRRPSLPHLGPLGHGVDISDVEGLERGAKCRRAMEEFGLISALATSILLLDGVYSAVNLRA